MNDNGLSYLMSRVCVLWRTVLDERMRTQIRSLYLLIGMDQTRIFRKY